MLLGIPLCGLYAYMQDRWRKWAGPDESAPLPLAILSLPFRYLNAGRKAKDGTAAFVFSAYWVLLAVAVFLAKLAMKRA